MLESRKRGHLIIYNQVAKEQEEAGTEIQDGLEEVVADATRQDEVTEEDSESYSTSKTCIQLRTNESAIIVTHDVAELARHGRHPKCLSWFYIFACVAGVESSLTHGKVGLWYLGILMRIPLLLEGGIVVA